jgi:DNA mismatch endonuclease (patch repair protein)
MGAGHPTLWRQRLPSPDHSPRAMTAPRFTGLSAASARSSTTKRRNRKRDTKPELLLRVALWRMGLRYRLDAADLPGRPDIVFLRPRLAVFVDGDFWHGRNWEERKQRLANGRNASYWIAKIGYNRERDARNTRLLLDDGWRVLRLWETDIRRDVSACVRQIIAILNNDEPLVFGRPPPPSTPGSASNLIPR